MAVTETKNPLSETSKAVAQLGAQFIRGFLESSDDVQDVVREMIGILKDSEADESDRQMALATMMDALFDQNSVFGVDLEGHDSNGRDTRSALREMEAEETAFAERVERLMAQRGLTQEQLAEAIGVKQPAVSMLLSRKARPQRRTVARIADALGVRVDELWPA